MPVVTSTTEEQNDANEKMWSALKRYIIRERQRKREEYEAEVEEERLRKEREARERQDVMTLEETKEQIEQLSQKLKQLEKEKQQLFMQLKKVLNEDEIRKRQRDKETNEGPPMKMAINNMQMPMMSFSQSQGEPQPTQRPPPLTSHILNKTKHSNYMIFPQQQSVVRGGMQQSVKRPRSPSPNYAYIPHRMPQMKHQPVYSDHKVEDGRMGRQMRAVLWNKNSQYSSASPVSSQAYYAMPSSGVVVERPPPLIYAAHHAHTPHTPHTPHHANLMYAPPQSHGLYMDMLKNREQHQEQKKEAQQPAVVLSLSEAHPPHNSGAVYAQPPARHMHKQHAIQLTTAKPGSITQGYPVQQQNPNVQNPNIYPNRGRY